MPEFTFKKEEKLKSRKIIGKLFSAGQSFGAFPLRLVWLEMNEKHGKSPIKFSVTVPKRAFPKAISRNRIKRLMREAWRLNKFWLYDKIDSEKQFAFMVIYTGREEKSLKEIENAMRRMNRKFLKMM